MLCPPAALSPGNLRKVPPPAAGHNARAHTRVEGVYGERISLTGFRSSEVWTGLNWRSWRCRSGLKVREKRCEVKRRAAAEADGEAVDEEVTAAEVKKQARILQLAVMFGIWYLLNIYFNIYNKQVLKVFPFPATFTAFQFGCGTVIVLLMWTLNLHPKPRFSSSQLAGVVALAVVHAIGNVLTNISLGKVSVSFTHTIKALEPFFTVVISALFLGTMPSLWVVSSLLPIVGGVALASLTEASFNWVGFCSAMASNVTNQSRNVFSKKLMGDKEESMDNINLFSVITIISFLLLVPVAMFMEGIRFTPSCIHSAVGKGMFQGAMYEIVAGWHLLPFISAGFLYDTADGFASNSCSGKLCEASSSHHLLCTILSNTCFTTQFLRDWDSTCWSFPVFKGKEYKG